MSTTGPGSDAPPPPQVIYVQAAPPPPPRKRSRLVTFAGGIVLLCGLCTVIGFLNTVVNGPRISATATAGSAAAGIAQAATAAAPTAAAGTAPPATDRAPTTEAAAPAAPTAAPTTPPLPSFGDTVPSLNNWTISLAKMESRDTLTWSSVGNRLRPSGKFWLIWVDAKNLQNESRGLHSTLDWELVDDHAATYSEASDANLISIASFVQLQGRDTLNSNVTPRAVTHPLLVFDVAADAKPAQLIVKSGALLSSDTVTFDLTQH